MLTTPRTTSRDFLWEQTLRMFRVASRAAVPKKSRLVARGGVTAFGTPLRPLFLCALVSTENVGTPSESWTTRDLDCVRSRELVAEPEARAFTPGA